VGAPEQANSLKRIVAPGDVLFVRGTGGLLELGTAGGLLGHVMLVVKAPELVGSRSEHARYLKSVWPSGGVTEIWKVRAVESSRSRDGLHEAELYLYVDRKSRRLLLLGELGDGEFDISNEAIEAWQSPEPLRPWMSDELVAEVLKEMRELGARANWSWTTAARAVLRADDDLSLYIDKAQLLQEIQECWAMDPICTSVVIHFWQRCLCKLAKIVSNAPNGMKKKPLDMILQWLPLKADRTLPGILLETMRKCGWRQWTTIPAPRVQAPVAKAKEPAPAPSPSAEPVPAKQAPLLPCTPVVQKYCRLHDTTQKRGKTTESRLAECTSCHMMIQTNYTDHSLCPPCSDKQDRCMVCGAGCSASTLDVQSCFSPVHHRQVAARPEEPSMRPAAPRLSGALDFAALAGAGSLVAPAVQSPAPAAVPPPVPPPSPPAVSPGRPRYCTAHSRPERRPKTEPRWRECTACHTQIQTNHLDFALCPPCSEKRDQCMLCGTAASEPRSFIPPPLTKAKTEDFSAKLRADTSIFCFVNEATLPPLPAAASLPAQNLQRFCSLHSRSERRTKTEPRLRECTACHVQIQTNYLDFALCPPCSNSREQCMCCGAGTSEALSFVPPPPPPPPSKADDQGGRSVGQGQVPPSFCCMHDSTLKRPKAEPRFRECTACRMKVQTNYAEMALCPPCSDKERRCMLCGANAGLSGSCMLTPPNLLSPLPVPNLLRTA